VFHRPFEVRAPLTTLFGSGGKDGEPASRRSLWVALEKFNVNVEKRDCRASSMVKPWEVRGSNKEERITKPL
jgi:hypothetical protein